MTLEKRYYTCTSCFLAFETEIDTDDKHNFANCPHCSSIGLSSLCCCMGTEKPTQGDVNNIRYRVKNTRGV
jgi:hypothetical protein